MKPARRHGIGTSARLPRDGYRLLLKPLLAGLAAVLLALAFAKLGGEVVEGDTRSFDMYFLHGAQALRASHPWLASVMRDLSGLGSTTVLTLFTVICIGYLVLVSDRTTAFLVAAAERSREQFGHRVPDARRTHCQFAPSNARAPLYLGHRSTHDAASRPEPYRSRSSLGNRRAGRVGLWCRLGVDMAARGSSTDGH